MSISITNNADALNVFNANFASFDTAKDRQNASSMLDVSPDGRVSMEDVAIVAANENNLYSQEEQAAAQYMLAHPELFQLADVASGDSPYGDGLMSQQDVQATLQSPLLETPLASPVSAFADPFNDCMGVLQSDFSVFDGAGDDGHQDGNVSMNDLVQIAYGEDEGYTLQQRGAARYLLDHMELFHKMDTDADGLIAISDVQTLAAQPAPENASVTQPDSLDSNHDGQLSDTELQIGAESLAPVLYLDPNDGFLLTDPEQYVENSYVTDEQGNYIADPVAFLGNPENAGRTLIVNPGVYLIEDMSQYAGNGIMVVPGTPQTLVEDPAAYFAEHPDGALLVIPRGQVINDPSQIGEGGDYYTAEGMHVEAPQEYLIDHPGSTLYWNPGDTANRVPDANKTYYEYDPGTHSITYYYFYPNNDGPAGGPGDLQNHEGDWERVTIKLDDEYRPETVYYSAHSGASGVAWNQVVKEEGRPVVFVATGSHANYFLPGDHYPTQFPTADDSTVDSPANGLRYDTRQTQITRINRSTPPWWYTPNIRWGEQGTFEWTSGPQGPNPDKNTLAP